MKKYLFISIALSLALSFFATNVFSMQNITITTVINNANIDEKVASLVYLEHCLKQEEALRDQAAAHPDEPPSTPQLDEGHPRLYRPKGTGRICRGAAGRHGRVVQTAPQGPWVH